MNMDCDPYHCYPDPDPYGMDPWDEQCPCEWETFFRGTPPCLKCTYESHPESLYRCPMCRGPKFRPGVCGACRAYVEYMYFQNKLGPRESLDWWYLEVEGSNLMIGGPFVVNKFTECPGFYVGNGEWRHLPFLPTLRRGGVFNPRKAWEGRLP